jgi:hypothetical protein
MGATPPKLHFDTSQDASSSHIAKPPRRHWWIVAGTRNKISVARRIRVPNASCLSPTCGSRHLPGRPLVQRLSKSVFSHVNTGQLVCRRKPTPNCSDLCLLSLVADRRYLESDGVHTYIRTCAKTVSLSGTLSCGKWSRAYAMIWVGMSYCTVA